MDVRGRWPVGDSIYAKMPTESYGIHCTMFKGENQERKRKEITIKMAYGVIAFYHLHMPSYIGKHLFPKVHK